MATVATWSAASSLAASSTPSITVTTEEVSENEMLTFVSRPRQGLSLARSRTADRTGQQLQSSRPTTTRSMSDWVSRQRSLATGKISTSANSVDSVIVQKLAPAATLSSSPTASRSEIRELQNQEDSQDRPNPQEQSPQEQDRPDPQNPQEQERQVPQQPNPQEREDADMPSPHKKQSTLKPTLKRKVSSLQILTDLGRNLIGGSGRGSKTNSSKTSPLASPNQPMSIKWDPSSSISTPAAQTPDIPEVKEVFESKTCPDLHSVNRALEALRRQQSPETEGHLAKLVQLAVQLEKVHMDCKKTLTDAMKARDSGTGDEVCRALCLSVTRHPHADVETRVYAYNILSTLASPGQAMFFVNRSIALIEGHSVKHPDECIKLNSFLTVLKFRALRKDGKVFDSEQEHEEDDEDNKEEGESGDNNNNEEEDDDDDGDDDDIALSTLLHGNAAALESISPRAEKILTWSEAAEE